MDDSKKGFVASSSNSSTISDSKICKLNESVYELHRPKDEPSMQVVFFHGFQYRTSDDVHLSTWKSGDGSHFWPQTWLVKKFPGAHVFCVSYDARVEKGEGNFDLPIIGENLTWDLMQANIGQVHLPVILVGHCFGGLVIKQLCLHAQVIIGLKSREDGLKFSKFLENVKGIFYYATPHHGVSRNILPWFGHESPLVPFVKKLSEHSARLNSGFDDLRQKNAWRVAGVGESRPTKALRGLFKDDVVVPEASARHGVDSFYSVKADHLSISKPETEISASFSKLTEFIDSIPLDLKDNLPIHKCQGLPYYPVDLQRQALEIQEKLKVESVLGIVGMGGIGKTTLVKQLFNNISREFEYTCFVDNAKGIKIHKLEDRLLGQFHRNGGKVNETEWSHLRGKKTLIVIDDVDSQDQLSILPELHHFGSDSRVIITSRNQRVLKKFEAYVIHEVEFLKEADAKTLFCKHAFKQGEIPFKQGEMPISLTMREQLVKDVEIVVQKCDGLPLTLEVIGRHLRGHETDANLWKETILRLGKAQPIDGDRDDRVWAKLQVSYESLGSEEQEMFINAATFFFGMPLEMALAAWSTTCGTPQTGWANLVSKSLVKEVYYLEVYHLNESNKKIWVHEHLRDLAKFLAPNNQMSTLNEVGLQNLPRLLNANLVDARIESLELHAEALMQNNEQMSRQLTFQSLLNLKQLKYVCLTDMVLTGSPKKLPRKISLLDWSGQLDGKIEDQKSQHFPVSCIEEMENLAVLSLCDWQTSHAFSEALGTLTNLRILVLGSMEGLNCLPENFGRLSHLKDLTLVGLSLSKLPKSFGSLSSLEHIQFEDLELTELSKSFGYLSSLVTVEFLNCQKLVTLPTNFGSLSSLKYIKFEKLNLMELPQSFGNLSSLIKVEFLNCQKLVTLPTNFGSLSSLEYIKFEKLDLMELPQSFGNLSSLIKVKFLKCQKLVTLPTNFGSLSSLEYIKFEKLALMELPQSFGNLSSLVTVEFFDCQKLVTLPANFGLLGSLETLKLGTKTTESIMLECLPDSFGQLKALRWLEMDVEKLHYLPSNFCFLSSLQELLISARHLEMLPTKFGQLDSLQTLTIRYLKIKNLPESLEMLSSLRYLTIEWCSELEFLPEGLGHIPSLQRLDVSYCRKLKSLPANLGVSLSLRNLTITWCGELEFLSEGLGHIPSLQRLVISHCLNLKSLPASLGVS